MGIYPKEEFQRHMNGTLTRIYDDFSGLVTTTVYVPILTIEARDNCYCCSCFEGHTDAYCRNHG